MEEAVERALDHQAKFLRRMTYSERGGDEERSRGAVERRKRKDELTEDESYEDERSVVDSRRGGNARWTVEENDEVDVSDPRSRVL